MAAGGDRIKVLKGGLLLIGILILSGILVMFSRNRQQAIPDSARMTAENKNSTIAMEGVHHTNISNGVKDWEFAAQSADYRLEENRVYLSMLQATFFDKNGDPVFLSAESGTWMTDSNDLEVGGNVVLKNSQCEIETGRLIFNKKERIFVTESPVAICYFSLCQEADGMTYSLDTGNFDLDGNIKGQFGNGIGL